MKYADLHIHSNYSDGVLSPSEIIHIAEQKNINTISITDHDSICSQFVLKGCETSVNIISGVEISTICNDSELHILGYFIDINNTELNDAMNKLKAIRLDRIRQIISKLNDLSVDISMQDIECCCRDTAGRSHIAKILVEKGYVDNYKAAFNNYLIKGRPAYVERYKFNYTETISLIRKAGGIPILAHPGKIYRNIDVEKVIKRLKDYGLCGVEVFHPSHSGMQVNKFFNLCKKYKLLVSGGSDCHGVCSNDGSNLIGQYGIDKEYLDKIVRFYNKL
ncbi:PHP domain-containing protein [Clostridium folliculivorans]|uniref:Phosphatase n=1 Tax=Clostridium folliculivorans TaxID=2886038 RepID=A0A9W5Y1B6_9CLOT|nr:PHP domain-containing protein [Clostridium folliculivorans]GKU24725.1 phosphatase [Clostridium folliculivorans]GKU30823.1 phosphatase [Clostridium folliculivorans]